jgi:hypothetical protein
MARTQPPHSGSKHPLCETFFSFVFLPCRTPLQPQYSHCFTLELKRDKKARVHFPLKQQKQTTTDIEAHTRRSCFLLQRHSVSVLSKPRLDLNPISVFYKCEPSVAFGGRRHFIEVKVTCALLGGGVSSTHFPRAAFTKQQKSECGAITEMW